MSTLKQLLEQRRIARGESSETSAPSPTSEAQPACLRVTTSAGETWIFPWAQLAAGHFSKIDQREELRLLFTSYEVRLSGVNLASLRDLVAALQLARIQPTPAKYQKTGSAEPFLESVHVSPHKGPVARSGASA